MRTSPGQEEVLSLLRSLGLAEVLFSLCSIAYAAR